MIRTLVTLLLLSAVVGTTWAGPAAARAAEVRNYDVVIYGGTSAALSAAVQVVRMGKTVAIVCPDKHLGGLSSGGLGFTDTGNKAVIGGLAREFYHHVWEYYQRPGAWVHQKQTEYGNKGQGTPAIDGAQRTMWIFEPHVAEAVFEQWVRENAIPVFRDQWLDREKGVTKDQGRITSITMTNGDTYTGRVFLDATYEGDLMAAAGVQYHVGRESVATYNEEFNGVQTGVLHHRHHFGVLPKPISPFVVPGDPTSGVLPRISKDPPGEKGAGDAKVQAYCYRMCLTQHEPNRVPFPKPAGYDPKQYELMLRIFEAGWRETFDKFDPIPNLKTDTNNHGPMSTDNIGMNYGYPEATYERRQEILQEHITYQQGWLYFIANDPRVPDDVRTEMAKWGLAKDEFTDNGNWPHQIYVREARRMVGLFVMTQNELQKTKPTPDSVGMGSYTIDSHNIQRYITPEGYVQNEGDIGVSTKGPYQIAYQSLVPKREQCTNLLVPVCVSSSHIAFGSIRMEPVFMILGQSAATAAVMAIEAESTVQDVPYDRLRERLVTSGQILEYTGLVPEGGKPGIEPAKLPGMVMDDSQAKFVGVWGTSAATPGYIGSGYAHDGNEGKGTKEMVFDFPIKESGQYEVRFGYTALANRATNVPVVVSASDGDHRYTVNEQRKPAVEGALHKLGVHSFLAGRTARVVVYTNGTDGYVVVDAVQLVPLK
jgi:hypothetical protein